MPDHIAYATNLLEPHPQAAHCPESRWFSEGDSCRRMVCALSVGIGKAMQMVRADIFMSDCYARGVVLFDAPAKKYLALASVGIFLAE
eukprot:11197675-Lingulodinium_polyedra.AAC.1